MDERRIDVAPAAIAKVIAAIALVWLWLHLWQLVMILLIAIVVAIGLDPVVGWLQRRFGTRSAQACPRGHGIRSFAAAPQSRR